MEMVRTLNAMNIFTARGKRETETWWTGINFEGGQTGQDRTGWVVDDRWVLFGGNDITSLGTRSKEREGKGKKGFELIETKTTNDG
jgi:hypothetical protein